MFNLKFEVKQIHEKIHKIGGFKNCMYLYIDLKYFNSLKTYIDFGSVEYYGLNNGNMKDFFLFLMAIIYVGSGDFTRKVSHCSSAKSYKHGRKNNPQKVHTNILEKWNKNTEICILEYCTNSSQDVTNLLESFMIIFLKTYRYNVANVCNGSLCYHWKQQPKLISTNFGFLLSFKIYQCFINGSSTPIKINDVMYTPRRMKN